MKLSIIVTNYKTPEPLKLCLISVFRQKTDFDFEVIVADIQAEFENRQFIEDDFPKAFYLPIKENTGMSKAVNIALRKSTGEFKLIINADIVLQKEGDLCLLVNYLDERKEIGILAPALLNFDNTVQQSYYRFYTLATILFRRTFLKKFSFAKKSLDFFSMRDVVISSDKNTAPFEVDWAMGAALMFQKEFFKKIGAFDERFFMYFEDVDIARRAKQKGLKVIYYPPVQVFHYHQKASTSGKGALDIFFNKYSRIHLYSALKYFLKHGLN